MKKPFASPPNVKQGTLCVRDKRGFVALISGGSVRYIPPVD